MLDSRRWRLALLAAPMALFFTGCQPSTEPKMVEAPKFVPTEADKKVPEGKPKGYGSGSLYEKSMNKSE